MVPFIGAFVGLMLGICIGYLSTKRLGTAFAMISLGFCELVTALTLIFVVFLMVKTAYKLTGLQEMNFLALLLDHKVKFII